MNHYDTVYDMGYGNVVVFATEHGGWSGETRLLKNIIIGYTQSDTKTWKADTQLSGKWRTFSIFLTSSWTVSFDFIWYDNDPNSEIALMPDEVLDAILNSATKIPELQD